MNASSPEQAVHFSIEKLAWLPTYTPKIFDRESGSGELVCSIDLSHIRLLVNGESLAITRDDTWMIG